MKAFLLALVFFAHTVQAAELKIAAAADLQFALKEMAQAYESAHPGMKLALSFGASGKFLTQIREGAPFDLFFSADTEKAEAVVAAKKNAGPTFPYAHGHLVLWALGTSKFSLDKDLKVLLQPEVKKIAVANATTAPYGQIAEAALKKANLFDAVKAKLVIGENISQTAQFVESGAASVGLLAKSLALSPALQGRGKFVDVAASLYEPLLQSGVVLKGPQEKEARAFKEYFLSAEGTKILARFGLSL